MTTNRSSKATLCDYSAGDGRGDCTRKHNLNRSQPTEKWVGDQRARGA
jgi:hypothetical protein